MAFWNHPVTQISQPNSAITYISSIESRGTYIVTGYVLDHSNQPRGKQHLTNVIDYHRASTAGADSYPDRFHNQESADDVVRPKLANWTVARSELGGFLGHE